MRQHPQHLRRGLVLAALALTAAPARAEVNVQCPGDADGDSIPDRFVGGQPNPDFREEVACAHLAAGDGFARMADGKDLYVFGFSDMTGVPAAEVMSRGMLAASIPAPTLSVDEGQQLYLNLSNVGMAMRPDLFDPHTVHWHGFRQASAIFDGMPDGAVSINMGATLTYYYRVGDPGTYMYHCHVEALEHMQMGMLGSLFVRPRQNKLPDGTVLGGFVHHTGDRYAYNDGDGSTRYDVEVPIQMSSFDPDFHDASESIQPLPFSDMRDRYGLLNGRGYPDTVIAGALAPSEKNGGLQSQTLSSRVEATEGQRVLLRVSNLSVTRFFTLTTLGLRMKVVGLHARLLRGPTGADLSYETGSVTLGGGESADVIIDTTGIAPGTYPLYSAELNYLNNDREEFGGMMTEILVLPRP